MKKKSLIITIISVFAFVLVATPVSILLADAIHTNIINNDYEDLKSNPEYQAPQLIEGIDLVKQDISCGYAVMEMFGDFCNVDVNEEQLYEYNDQNIVTASTSGFENEMNRVFTEYETKSYRWLKSSSLISMCYESIKEGIPVPFEMAYKLDGAWTLHFSLLIGIDLVKDQFRILNPYGFDEIMTADQFISHTSYKAWEKMPFYLSFAFGLTIFDKNTIFIAKKR